MDGIAGVQPGDSPANIRGGSHAVKTARDSIPGPKFIFTATGLPSCSSNSVGTNQDEIPGPVAMACQTSSGVPGTSTSTSTERRPEASFFTLMFSPWDWLVPGLMLDEIFRLGFCLIRRGGIVGDTSE